jgi:hypothetical protein
MTESEARRSVLHPYADSVGESLRWVSIPRLPSPWHLISFEVLDLMSGVVADESAPIDPDGSTIIVRHEVVAMRQRGEPCGF